MPTYKQQKKLALNDLLSRPRKGRGIRRNPVRGEQIRKLGPIASTNPPGRNPPPHRNKPARDALEMGKKVGRVQGFALDEMLKKPRRNPRRRLF